MLPALEAILGHRSAHSLATGPVIAEPGKREDDSALEARVRAELVQGSISHKRYLSPVALSEENLGPLSVPFISPLLFTITPALSSK